LILSAVILQQLGFPFKALTVEATTSDKAEESAGDAELVEAKGCVPCTSWVSPDLVPWATVLCIHGFTLDKNAYSDFGKRLSTVGIPTYAIDVRGFGSWQKSKGHTKLNFAQALEDVHEAIRAIHKAHPHLPLVLVGESMGGALALQATAQDQTSLAGLICSVPASQRYGARKTNRKVAFSALKGMNHLTDVGTRIVSQITGNEDLRAELEADPDARMDYSPKEMLQFQRFMNKTDKRAPEIKRIPVLFLQGGSDRLVKISGTAKAYEKIGSADKDFVLVGESEHLVLEAGQCTDHTIDVVTSWIYQHAYQQFAENLKQLAIPDANLKTAHGHLKVGQGLMDLDDPEGARQHLMQAIQTGRGTPIAMIASQLLAGLPKSPAELAYEQQNANSNATFVSHAEAMANDKPTVIFFGAKWIEPSFELNAAMLRALKIYGDHVNFVRVDADLTENAPLVKAYDITLIPTVLILNWKNDVVATKFGPLSDRVLAALIDRGLFDSKFAKKTETIAATASTAASASAPQEAKAKPSVVFYGSLKQAPSQKVWAMLQSFSKEYTDQFDLIRLDSDDPKNAARVPKNECTSLPAVLFLNSANDQVAFSTGDVDEEQLKSQLSDLLSGKHVPEAPKEI
jgi:alpha-beta hydrolase superfamily lysophospholipase/thioredoxin-like negative regulator of GroEL